MDVRDSRHTWKKFSVISSFVASVVKTWAEPGADRSVPRIIDAAS